MKNNRIQLPSKIMLCLPFLLLGMASGFVPSTISADKNKIHSLGWSMKDLGYSTRQSKENGLDEEYPWCFKGRVWFRPALVRVEDCNTESLEELGGVTLLNLFGYTIGGTVALEYDSSPVGPYREFVTMGGLVAYPQEGMIGQWGSRLYVSTREAEQICQDTWGVPAEVANIQFKEDGSSLRINSSPDPLSEGPINIDVEGWSKTRTSDADAPIRGGIPIAWTPTIKALWLRLLPSFSGRNNLPVHKLRLSGSSISLQLCGQAPSSSLGYPLGIGLSVDNVLIEIGRENGKV